MPITTNSLNKSLYQLLKVRGFDPVPKDSEGETTPVPEDADVFKFTFKRNDKPYGTAWVTIDSNQKLIVYYKDEINSVDAVDEDRNFGDYDDSWTGFLKNLKMWAQRRQLGFDLENQDHLASDMAQRAHMKKKENIAEGYYPMGKQASYSDAIPTVKIVLQHTRQIQEGEQRFRNIARIFLENTQGERILCPFNRPGVAQVYARHLAEGGKPNDDRWNHITGLCEEYTKMSGFARAVKNGQFNESAQKLVEAGVNHFLSLRESLGKMRGHRGYNAYFESWTPALMESEGDEPININELFVQETLDPRIESVMPILSKLSKNLGEMKEVDELAEWADNLTELAEPEPISRQEYASKKKELQRIQMDPETAKSPILRKEVMKKLAQLQLRAKQSGFAVAEEEIREEMPAAGTEYDPRATMQYASKMKQALMDKTNATVNDIANKDGSVTLVVNPSVQNPAVGSIVAGTEGATARNISAAIDPYYTMFRQKGWRFDQPAQGRVTFAVPVQQGVAEAKSPEAFLSQLGKLATAEQQFKVGDWVTIDPNETSGYASSGMTGQITKLYTDDGERMAEIAVGASSGVQKKMKLRGNVFGPKDIEMDLGRGIRSYGSKTAVPISILQKDDPQGVAEGFEEVEESGLQAYLGNKKYGKEGMNALRKAGQEGASKEKMTNIRDKYDKLDEEDMEEGVVDTLKKVGKKVLDVVAPDDEKLLKQLQQRAGIPAHAQHGKPRMAVPNDEKEVAEGSDKKLEFSSFKEAQKYFSDLAHERGTSPVEMYGKGDSERYRQYVLKHVKKKEQDVAEATDDKKFNSMMGNITKKKMAVDRKTGKEYDPEEEMTKLLGKHKSQFQGMSAIEKAQKKGVAEDLDADQKRAGQLGPTGGPAKVGDLVGTNESTDPLKDMLRLLGR